MERSTRAPVLTVAVDVGGTGTRVRLASDATPTTEDIDFPGAGITTAGLDVGGLIDAVRTAIDRTPARTGEHRRISLAVGSTGFPELVAEPDALLEALRGLGAERVVLAADAVTAHVGALGFAPGVVLAAGTGVVALGTDLVDQWHRVDGWGHLLGDDGGGAWIGMHGLRAATRAIDGRPDGSAPLERLARARFGAPDVLVRDLYARDDRAGAMASFAPDVLAAADGGDAIAADIVRRAAGHLADTAIAAARRSGQHVVAHTGRLLDAGHPLTRSLREPLRDRLRSAAGLELRPALGTALDGATTLARLAADDPERLPRPGDHLITTITTSP